MKKKTSIVLKLIILFITVAYMSYFIYDILNNDFEVNTLLIIKSSLIILNTLILLITLISKYIGKITCILNIIIILILIGIHIYPLIPKEEIKQEEINCTNDNISVKVLYTKDKVNKIIYTHIFDGEEAEGAQNFVNKFDNQYLAFDSIYSEIIFGDNIEINLTYDIDNTDMDKLNEIYDYDLSKLEELKTHELNNYICK